MTRTQTAAVIIVAIITAYWAYSMINSLLSELSNQVSFIDLGAIYIMGLFSGVMIGTLIAFSRKKASGE